MLLLDPVQQVLQCRSLFSAENDPSKWAEFDQDDRGFADNCEWKNLIPFRSMSNDFPLLLSCEGAKGGEASLKLLMGKARFFSSLSHLSTRIEALLLFF